MKIEVDHILKTLKKELSVLKITYKDIADKLEMSESGIKKLLNGNDIKLDRLINICDLCKISFSELMKKAEVEVPFKQFTQKEEDYFLENHNSYFFYLSLERHQFNFQEVLTKMKVSRKIGEKNLKDLIKIGILKRDEKVIRGKYEGFPRIEGKALASLSNTRFEEVFFSRLEEYRLKGKYKGLYGRGSFYCRPEQMENLKKDIEDLIVKYSTDEGGEEYQYLIGMLEEPYFNFLRS
ncbi:MAG: helix-turn-helix domain-containing protein [Bacteriovoracaceae bacterium]|nr:helix-turn-helix domain-containing protein [Bacteriovoracaceae bacterium]